METDSIWLDRLPLDVCIRIAKCAETSNHQSAIQLAVASPTQRAAFLRAVKYTLDFAKIAKQGFGDVVSIQVQDGFEGASEDERDSRPDDERSSDPADSSAPGADAATSADLGSCCDHASENCSNDGDYHSVCDEADGDSIAQNGNASHDDVESCRDAQTHDGDAYHDTEACSDDEDENGSDEANGSCSRSGTEGANTDHDADGRSDDENETGSDNASVSPSGNETGDDSNDSENSLPKEHEELRKYIVMSFQRDYAALINDDVREIIIGGEAEDIFNEPVIQSCLTSATLLKLRVCLLSNDILSIKHGCNIRSLDLLLHDCDILTLVRGFSSLQLRELKLVMTGEKCLHGYLSDDPEGHRLLAHMFPQVESLDLSCAVCGERDEEPPWYLWHAIEKFPNLKDVTLCEGVPDSAIERLREMERVTLIAGDMRKLVENIPDRITSISTSRIWTKLFPRRVVSCENGFAMLANCVQLEELNCVMRPGSEIGVVAIAGNLRSLGLAFAQVEREEDSWGTAPVPLEPKEGVLLEIVRSAPFLKSLRLVNMRVQRGELREILVATGTRLEEFEEEVFVEKWVDQYSSHGGTFMFQKKDNKLEMEELANTLRTAAFNNPKLKTFELDVRAGWFTDMDAVISTLPTVKASLDVLQRHAVGLNARSLKELITKFETGYFGLIDMMMSVRLSGVAMVAVPSAQQ